MTGATRRVLELLLDSFDAAGEMYGKELADKIGVTPQAVHHILVQLIERRWLRYRWGVVNGRRCRYVRIDPWRAHEVRARLGR